MAERPERDAASFRAEAAAWREVAEWVVAGNRMDYGLCAIAGDLSMLGRFDFQMERLLVRRAMRHMSALPAVGDGPRPLYAYKTGTQREARTLAALWMALEAEEDAALQAVA